MTSGMDAQISVGGATMNYNKTQTVKKSLLLGMAS